MLECINLINKIQLAVERKHSFIILSGELSKSTKELLNLLEENGWICFYKQSKVKDILKTQVKFRFNSMRKNIINSIKLIGNNKDATFISITNL
jgi:ribosomal protein S8